MADNWLDLYDFETAIEGAARQVLLNAGATNVYTQRDQSSVATPRVSLQFTLTACSEHYGLRASDQVPFLDTWMGTLSAEIATDRTRNSSNHPTLRAAVRHTLAQWSLYTSDLMPDHEMVRILPAATSPMIQVEGNLDVSVVNLDVTLCIRPDAWPTGDTPMTADLTSLFVDSTLPIDTSYIPTETP